MIALPVFRATTSAWGVVERPSHSRSCLRQPAGVKMENEWNAEQVVKQLEDIGAKVFFEKQLTSSDVSASGRVVVPKVRCLTIGLQYTRCSF